MSERPSEELISARASLTSKLDESRDAYRKALAAMRDAKQDVLDFDQQHPEVMQYLNFIVGEANKKQAEGEE